MDEGEAIEEVGERQALLGDDGRVAAIIEITRVETHGFSAVSWEFAQAEGEGFRSIEDWRERHHSFFAECGVNVDEHTLIVCVWFRILERAPRLNDRTPARGVPPYRFGARFVAAFCATSVSVDQATLSRGQLG